ncbi:MAG: hypothetical protein JNL19_13845 [Burkholderiales bacterium]|nr:hypothetical protein [Burkholderiales bacterium]
MSKHNQAASALREHFAAARREREQASATHVLAADRLAVRRWQQARLAVTHADLLAADESGPAARFFLSELYSTDDLTQRDADIERVIRVLVKFLPDRALATLAAALEMDALSELLDARLGRTLRSRAGTDEALVITAKDYASAYREMGCADLRLRQIALTEEIGLALNKLARMPLLAGLLRMMRAPAHASGVGELHEFLERGYAAFAHMQDGRTFIQTIVSRERNEHQRLTGDR